MRWRDVMPQINSSVPVVREWIASVRADDGEVGEIDVHAFIRKQWPEFAPEVRDAIACEVIS